MRSPVEFLLRLLERPPAAAAWEDFAGERGELLRHCQDLGFVALEAFRNPIAGCPNCEDGVPCEIGTRLLCDRCHSTIDPSEVQLWPLDREAFLRWLAQRLGLKGGVRLLDENLWQLGTGRSGEDIFEGFFTTSRNLTATGRQRIESYRATVLFHGLEQPQAEIDGCVRVSLLGLLRFEGTLQILSPPSFFRRAVTVRFDARSGVLWAGVDRLGEVPVGSKEWAFLDCLAGQLDHFVPYAEIKRHVLAKAGSGDTTEEATFCHGLKRRLKRRIRSIDRLLSTTNKGDGYCLRAAAES